MGMVDFRWSFWWSGVERRGEESWMVMAMAMAMAMGTGMVARYIRLHVYY